MTKHLPTSRRLGLLLCFAAASSCAWGLEAKTKPASSAAIAADPNVRYVAGANTGFALRLLGRLTRDQPTGNVFLSPLSVSTALTMTLNGAGGKTQSDMAQTLGLGLKTAPLDRINQANGLLLPSLTQTDAQVSIANALWADKGATFAPDFQQRCRHFYNAQATALDLSSPAAVNTINGWASRNTQGKIPLLVTHGDIAQAPAVLTDAVYFHGKWQTPFNKAVTKAAPFHLDGGHTRSVPLMRQGGSLSYLETLQFQAVSLPYGIGRMRLYVFLPKAGKTADALASGFTAQTWTTAVAAMKPTGVVLSLPRFKAKCGTHLRKPLCDLGMLSAFRPGADFGPMGLHGVFLSDVIHEAVIEVNEEGTVAAAATAVGTARGLDLTPHVMLVDHPFFIVLRDNATGTILFEGIIRDPQ